MIGLLLSWSGKPLDRGRIERFVAAFDSGKQAPHSSIFPRGAAVAVSASGRPLPRSSPSGSWQPLEHHSGAWVLLEGHIDNTAVAWRDLGGAKSPADDVAALYAAGLDAWGNDVDRKLVGEYCAIVVDPTRRRVLLASSPISAPPLHIWGDDEHLVVASTARAIFATGLPHPQVDEQKIADTLFLNYREAERSWFRGVSRLPAGARAELTPGACRLRRYYDIASLPAVRLPSDRDYVEAARELFIEGTRAALQGFQTPAVSLSGGYDSQSVAAHALRLLPAQSRLLALTSVPEAAWDRRLEKGSGDERDNVLALQKQYSNLDVELVDAAGLSFEHRLEDMFRHAGSVPRNAVNLHWMHEIWSGARARGCDVMLTGQFGNATFSFAGTGALPQMLLMGQWGRLRRELQCVRGGQSLPRALASRVLMPFLPYTPWRAMMRRRYGALDPLESWCPLNPDWAREMRVLERARDMGYDPFNRPVRSARAWREATMCNAPNEIGTIYQALELLHDIPTRDPTSYRPLVELCLGIPDDQFIRDGESRWLARRMLRGVVPDQVLDDRRRGVQAADWHLRLGRQRSELRHELDELSRDPAMAHRLNLPALTAALEAWPETTPTRADVIGIRLQHALPRAVTTARFIRYVERIAKGEQL